MDQLADGFIDENVPGFDLVEPGAFAPNAKRPRFVKLVYHTQTKDAELDAEMELDAAFSTQPPFLLDAPDKSTCFVSDKCVHRLQYALGLIFCHA